MSATDEIKNYYLSLGIKESVYNFCEATEQVMSCGWENRVFSPPVLLT